jgi:hypothetical protein
VAEPGQITVSLQVKGRLPEGDFETKCLGRKELVGGAEMVEIFSVEESFLPDVTPTALT